MDKALGHDFKDSGEEVLNFAAALDPVASRYQPFDFEARYPALASWEPRVRYEKTGTRKAHDVTVAWEQSRAAVDAIVLGPHQPVVLRFDLQLLRFASLRTVDERLMDRHYRALCDRLLELLHPPDEAGE